MQAERGRGTRGRSTGTHSSSHGPGCKESLAPHGDETDEIDDPIAVCAQLHVISARPSEVGSEGLAAVSTELGVPFPHRSVCRIDEATPPRLRIDERHQTDVGQFDLAPVKDLDRHDIMTLAQGS